MADSNKPSGTGGGDDQARRLAKIELRQAKILGEMRGFARELDVLWKTMRFVAGLVLTVIGMFVGVALYAIGKADANRELLYDLQLNNALQAKEIQREGESEAAGVGLQGTADSPSPIDSPDAPDSPPPSSPSDSPDSPDSPAE